jgi:hypothetical protein
MKPAIDELLLKMLDSDFETGPATFDILSARFQSSQGKTQRYDSIGLSGEILD